MGPKCIEKHPETPHTSYHHRIEGFKGTLYWVPMMPKHVGLSDNQRKVYQTGIVQRYR